MLVGLGFTIAILFGVVGLAQWFMSFGWFIKIVISISLFFGWAYLSLEGGMCELGCFG